MKLPRELSDYFYWKVKRMRGQGDIKSRLLQLLETQYYSPQQINKLQFEKFHQQLEKAYQFIPYYRRVMDERELKPADFTSFKDIKKLPILSRDVLHKEQKNLLSSKADFASLRTNFSSGSTGRRAEFKQDANFRMWMRAHQLRTYSWCADWQLGDPFVLLWGSEIYWSKKQFTDHLENLLTNRREFNTFRLSKHLINNFLDKIIDFKPKLISTYSNAIHLIAAEAERRKLNFSGIAAIQGTSEPLPPTMRDRIARVFNCEVFDKYGSRETNVVSHESPSHEEMCIQAENVFVEFLTPEGEDCQYGEHGKLIITTLNNESMPLIRYETQDLAAPVSGYCSSGIGLPRMTSVAGRIQDLIVTPKGDYIDAYFFSYLIMRFPEVEWFQVTQSERDRLHIKVFAPKGISKKRFEEIKERIQHHTGYPFIIDLERLHAMPDSSTGKFRLCVSELTEQVY